MFHRVTAIIAFIDPDEANDFYHDCELALAKGVSINPDMINEEASTILLEQCRHDEDPPGPCITIKEDSSS